MPRIEKRGLPTAVPIDVEALVGLGSGGVGAPTLTMEELAAVRGALAEMAPSLAPPAEVAAEEDEAEQAITAWHNAVQITALWINAAPRNAFAAVQGLGWRKVHPANDSSFLALTGMLAHARQMNASCNVRIESDNQIHEVYVW